MFTTNTTKTKKPSAVPKQPKLKIGPFQGGIGVAVWLNEIQTETGPKMVRSITLSPRRYLDRKTGQWKDAASYRPGDLYALQLGLAKALEYCLSVPLPGESSEDDRLAAPPTNDQILY